MKEQPAQKCRKLLKDTLAEADDGFAGAGARLLQLVDEPVALRVLADSRLRELRFTSIEGQAGPVVCQTFGAAHDIARLVT